MGEKTKEKKKLKASDVIITILVIGLIVFGGYYLVTNYLLAPNHTVVVNDKEIVMKNSAKELIDQGFVLCNVNGITADLRYVLFYRHSYNIGSCGLHRR